MYKRPSHIKLVFFWIGLAVLLNVLANSLYKRFDLTKDKRYTLSEATLDIIENARSVVLVEVLLQGNFPAEFRRLQAETRQLLEEFSAHNSNIKFTFVNPVEDEEIAAEVQNELAEIGILPARVNTRESGRITQTEVYPWAIISHNEMAVKVPLLKNQLGATSEERITASLQNLEYAFADAFSKLLLPKKKKVAVLKGNGQLDDAYIADFFSTLREYYFIAPFTLDSAAVNPQKTLQQIKEFDLIVSAKPTEAFTDTEKYILDQYTMQGGKSLWLIDAVAIEMEDLRDNGAAYALPRDLNLTDFFFRYGLRINPVLVNDMYAAPITLASGQDTGSQYDRYPWFYAPLAMSTNNHPIVTNMEAVKFDFANAIDTLSNDITKTVLLQSSPFTKLVGVPREISLDEITANIETINKGPDPERFSAGQVPLAVLLEGSFTSAFKNRLKPFPAANMLEEGAPAKMIVISDGDVIKNQLQGRRPVELGFDRWTNTRYGNKDFLLNAVNYLLDDNGLINIRSKEILVPFLDTTKVVEQQTKWQLLNLLLPVAFLLLFGMVFQWLRKKANN